LALGGGEQLVKRGFRTAPHKAALVTDDEMDSTTPKDLRRRERLPVFVVAGCAAVNGCGR
jgi:hypothetical protein